MEENTQETKDVVSEQQPNKKGKTVAILGVIFGILGIGLGLIPILGIVLGIPFALAGLVLGIIGMVKNSKRVLHWLGLLFPILAFVAIFVLMPIIARNVMNRSWQKIQEMQASGELEVNPEFQEAMQNLREAMNNGEPVEDATVKLDADVHVDNGVDVETTTEGEG